MAKRFDYDEPDEKAARRDQKKQRPMQVHGLKGAQYARERSWKEKQRHLRDR